jgi:hypothetical protein
MNKLHLAGEWSWGVGVVWEEDGRNQSRSYDREERKRGVCTIRIKCIRV